MYNVQTHVFTLLEKRRRNYEYIYQVGYQNHFSVILSLFQILRTMNTNNVGCTLDFGLSFITLRIRRLVISKMTSSVIAFVAHLPLLTADQVVKVSEWAHPRSRDYKAVCDENGAHNYVVLEEERDGTKA